MNKSVLRLFTVLLGTGLAVVPFLGLDDLPRTVRGLIDSERASMASATSQIQRARADVTRELDADADVFRTVPASKQWPAQLDGAQAQLQSAQRDLDQLAAIEKQNRRGDGDRAQRLLTDIRPLRDSAVRQASSVESEAARWSQLKRNLPGQLDDMNRAYQAILSYDFGAVNSAIQRAEADWPAKKTDLDARLAALKQLQMTGEQAWTASADVRKAAAAKDFAHIDFGALGTAGDTLRTDAAQLPQTGSAIVALSSQLYNSWDKILVDMRERGHGNSREYDQEIRAVTTKLPNAAAKTGETTSDESWHTVSPATYKAEQNDLGMTVAHKDAGKYDSEANTVPQPAGFAYVAPVGQSNQYGYWNNSGGQSFWVFYGQYALMRDLLFNHSYTPLGRSEWDDYYSYQRRGQTYYGHDETINSAPKYGTQGSTTQDRYSGSTYAKGGGFKNSPFASKSGSYRNGPFSSPNASNPNANHAPQHFGNGASPAPSAPRYRPSAPSPRPSFRPSAPRRFGRH